MLNNIIKFKANKEYIKHYPECLPVPGRVNIPEWFKKLEHGVAKKTIKGCMPFLDSMTAGYILKMPIDYYIAHNVEHEGKLKTGMISGAVPLKRFDVSREINLNYGQEELHNTRQLGESPYVEKNKNLPIHKILNPWFIKTPPGYSCLFLPPMNNTDDRFSIIPGIVDTDTFTQEINFPFIVNGDKYPTLETTIKIGTPYVQVIPFKRESWKMKIQPLGSEEIQQNIFSKAKRVIHNYKNLMWHKKSWK
tara:strand:+ start:293 stop:1039 length:747 start_codon:yes stop_codon:yes gene_type:complete